MPLYVDQTGTSVEIPQKPQLIISLVPSQTELLYDLGLNKEVIGITKFCVHPREWFRTKQRVGGTKQLKLDLIRQLHPDLIIANKEENLKEQVEQLRSEFSVWTSDISNLEEALEMIGQLGTITGTKEMAAGIMETIRSLFHQVSPLHPPVRTAYLIWKDPYMTVGGDTFIHDIMKKAGLANIFADETRYPVINIADLADRNCSLLLLSSEPFPFQEKHVEELQGLLPATNILLVDGEMFSWYGSRLRETAGYLQQLITVVG